MKFKKSIAIQNKKAGGTNICNMCVSRYASYYHSADYICTNLYTFFPNHTEINAIVIQIRRKLITN